MRRQPRRCSLCSPKANYLHYDARGNVALRNDGQVAFCFASKSYTRRLCPRLWTTTGTTHEFGVSSGYADDAQKMGRGGSAEGLRWSTPTALVTVQAPAEELGCNCDGGEGCSLNCR